MNGTINELPNIDTSRYSIDENGNVLRDKRITDNDKCCICGKVLFINGKRQTNLCYHLGLQRNWELKRELVKLGNKGMYQKQIDFMLKNKKFLDTQFCVMFIISFDLTEREKIPSELIKILNKKKFVKNYDFTTLIRLSVINNELEVKE